MSTMTRPGVKCGNHRQPTYHSSVTDVRECYRNSGKGSKRVESLDDKLDAAFGEPKIPTKPAEWYDVTLAERADREFDEMVRERELAEDARVAREKMAREMPVCLVSSPVTRDGIYRNPQTGDIFKVYHTVHGANQLVAKRLHLLPESQWSMKRVRGKDVIVKAHFVYEGKAGLRGLTAEMQMTLEEGKKYGAIYGVCVRCCATLTAEVSIERAMGPICAGKANWA